MRTSSTFRFAAVIGHQGGWDEALLVLTPMLFVGWLLWVAKRRMERRAPTTDAGDEATTPTGDEATTPTGDEATTPTGEGSDPLDTGAD